MPFRNPVFTSTILVAVLIGLTGCSTFKGHREMDMTPFSENTEILFSEAVKVSTPFQYKYLRSYRDMPEMQEGVELGQQLLAALRGVVFYSNQVVAINSARLSSREKNRHLADYLSGVIEKARVKAGADSVVFGNTTLESVLDDVRRADTFLDGVAAAEPIVNAVVVAIQRGLDEYERGVIPRLVSGFDRQIEADVAEMRANYANLKMLQARSLRASTLLYRGRMGDPEALQLLLEEDPSITGFFTTPEKATAAQLDAAEQYLAHRLNMIDVMIHQMDNDREQYNARRDELEVWRVTIDDKVMIARQAIMFWAQSHRSLGEGIAVPPLIDVKAMTGNTIQSVTSKL